MKNKTQPHSLRKPAALHRIAQVVKSPSFLTIAGILGAAFVLRVVHVGWALPEVYEEATPMRMAWKMWNWDGAGLDFNPHFFNYPALSFYFDFIAQSIQYCAGYLGGAYAGLKDFQQAYDANPTAFVIVCRLVSIAFDLGTVYIVYRFGSELASRRAGIFAGVLTAFNILMIKQAHLINVDSPLTFFVMLSLYFMLRLQQTGERRWYVWTAIGIGCAAACKYNGFFLVPAMICAALGRCESTKEAVRTLQQPRIIWSVILCGAIFFALNPYVVLDFREFFNNFSFEESHMASGHLGNDPTVGTVQFYVLNVFPGALGWLGAVAVLGSLAWCVARWRREYLPMLAFALLYVAVLFTWKMRAERYVLPVLPPSILLVAFAAEAMCTEAPTWATARGLLEQSGLKATGLLASLAVLLTIQPLNSTLHYYQSFSKPDSRVAAYGWLESHLPAGSIIATIPFGLKYDPDKFEQFMIPFFPQDPDRMMPYYDARWYTDFELVVGTDYDYARFLQDTVRFRKFVDYYRTLNTRWTKVYEINPEENQSGPAVWIYRRPDGLKDSPIDDDMIRSVIAVNDPVTGTEFFNALVAVLADKGHFQKADAVMRASLSLHANDYEGLKIHARILSKLLQYPEALTEIEKAIGIHPADADAYALRGVICARLSDLPGAIASAQEAISIDRKFGLAYEELSEMYQSEGANDKAIQILRTYYETLNPESTEARQVLAKIGQIVPAK